MNITMHDDQPTASQSTMEECRLSRSTNGHKNDLPGKTANIAVGAIHASLGNNHAVPSDRAPLDKRREMCKNPSEILNIRC